MNNHALAGWIIGLGLCAAMIGPGCEKSSPVAKPGTAVDRYLTRGRVEGVTNRPGVTPMVQVHHEAIAGFKDRAGKVVGMKEMVMDFPAGSGVAIDGLRTGDLIEVEFEVDWGKVPYHSATRISKLPPNTALNLGKFEGQTKTPGK